MVSVEIGFTEVFSALGVACACADVETEPKCNRVFSSSRVKKTIKISIDKMKIVAPTTVNGSRLLVKPNKAEPTPRKDRIDKIVAIKPAVLKRLEKNITNLFKSRSVPFILPPLSHLFYVAITTNSAY